MVTMITGGTGFLGSYLARHLVFEKGIRGKDLVLFDRYPNYGYIKEVQDKVTLVVGDVTQPTEVAAAMKTYGVDQVYHLAAILGDPPPTQVTPYLKIMCEGVWNVLELSRIYGVRRVVYASSVAVYGPASYRARPTNTELSEDDLPAPGAGLYGTCKLFSENLAQTYSKNFGLSTVGVRPTSVFGLGRNIRGSAASGLRRAQEKPHYMCLPELAAVGQPVEMPPDDLESDWIYGADAAEVMWCAMTTPKPPRLVYNLAAETRRTGDATAHLRKILPDAKITVSKGPVSTVPRMNFQALRTDLGFKPRYTMEQGITHYVNLVRERAGLPPVKG